MFLRIAILTCGVCEPGILPVDVVGTDVVDGTDITGLPVVLGGNPPVPVAPGISRLIPIGIPGLLPKLVPIPFPGLNATPGPRLKLGPNPRPVLKPIPVPSPGLRPIPIGILVGVLVTEVDVVVGRDWLLANDVFLK